MEQPKEYYAFISYKREDEKWAKWLQDKLEHYKFPSNLNGRTDLPKNIRPTFRDVTDLNPGLLAEEINNALLNSEWLIVVCSPRSAKSPWVCKEAQTFIDHGRADQIIPFVIEGNPFSSDTTTECYPEALLNLTGSKELLAANINEMGRDAAAIKVVARMFNLRFDALWQRYEREQKRKKWMLIGGAFLIALLGLSIGGYFVEQNRIIESQNNQLIEAANHLREDSVTLAKHIRRIQNDSVRLSSQNDSISLQNKLILQQRNDLNYANMRLGSLNWDLKKVNIDLLHSNQLLSEERDRVSKVNWKMMENQSRYLAGVMNDLSKEGNSDIAQKIGLCILPQNEDLTDRPCPFEIEMAFRYACRHSVLTMRGHTESVNNASFSPDGKYIATASNDNTLKIWDTYSTDLVMSIKHPYQVFYVCYSPNGNNIASYSGDQLMRIWDSMTGDLIKAFECRQVKKMMFSPDGKYIAYASSDNTICIIDAVTGTKKRIFEGHSDYVMSVSYSLDGKKLVSASGDGTVKIWDVNSGKCLHTMAKHSNWVGDAQFSPNGKMVVSCGADRIVRIWDVETGNLLENLEGHNGWIGGVCFNKQGNLVASASEDKTVKIWDIYTGNCLKILKGHTAPVEMVAFSPDGKSLVSTSRDNTSRIWALTTDQSKLSLEKHRERILDLKISPDGKLFATASMDSTIGLWDAQSDKCLQILKGHGEGVLSIDISQDNKFLVSSSNDCKVKIWNCQTGACVKTIHDLKQRARCVKFFKGGSLVISGSDDGTVRIWKSNTGEQIDTISLGICYIYDIAISKDEKNIAFGTPSGVKVWRVLSKEIRDISGFATSLAYSPDGNYLFCSSLDDDILMFDVPSYKCVKKFSGHSDLINSIAFSHNGKYMISASNDKTIRIWDIFAGKCVEVLEGHSYFVSTSLFNSDDKTVISGSGDGTIRIWDFLPLPQLIDQTRERFKNCLLTPEERRKYYME